MEKIHTTCVYCGCGCGLFLHVDGGRVVGATPSPSHPLSRGRLCIKGWLGGEFVNHPDRLTTPLISKGERHVKASWDEALSTVAGRLLEIRDESGPDALAVLTSAKGTNEENYLLMKFARAGLGTNNVDHVARLCHAPTVAGLGHAFGSGAMTNSIKSLLSSDLILVAGSNTTGQHPLVAAHILEARARGAQLIVVDPRKTQIGDLADIYVSTKPGSNVAWINYLLKVIIDEGLTDEDFISSRTEGFEAVKDDVSGYTPEAVEDICGASADLLRRAALAYGTAKRAAIVYAMGITQHTSGTDNVLALANLALATGNVGREGTGIYPLRGHQNVQGACDMGALPDTYCGYQKVTSHRERFEEAWGSDLPAAPGLTAVEMLEAAEEGRIKGLYVSGENPMMSYPDQGAVKRALESLEFLAVADIFPTETTAMADVVLPVASYAENEGTNTSTERRVQKVNPALPPPGAARQEWKVACDLLEAFGVPAGYSSPAEVMEEIATLSPHYAGISYEVLKVGGIQWPCPEKGHPGTDVLHQERFPIGRARFSPVRVREVHEAPDRDYPFTLTTGRSLFHFHTGTMTRRTSLLDREVKGPWAEINPTDAEGLGIRDGQMVEIESRRGRLQVGARLDSRMRQGTVFLPFHFKEAPANVLTSRSLDPSSKIPAFKVSAVRIRGLKP